MRYPIGVQTFSKIIESGNVYVDKTDLVFDLAQSWVNFLSRPRRFGKSLLLSTLASYFRGEKEFFRGLKIDRMEKDWVKYPVFHIDFNSANYTLGVSSLMESMDFTLKGLEAEFGYEDSDKSAAIRFAQLIKRAYKQTGQKVVILVDEYDKPMTETMNQPEIHEQMRNELRSFYGVLKSCDQYIRFALLTGVTKFSKLGIFSDLNNLRDISLSPEFATICGITDDEIEEVFHDEVVKFAIANNKDYDEARRDLRHAYNGYHFSKSMTDSVYNPFSLLNALESKEILYFWNATGCPRFLGPMLSRAHVNPADLEGCSVLVSRLLDYRAGDTNVIPLLYQAGYLTIRGYEMGEYILGFPNDEVRDGFIRMYLRECMDAPLASSGDFSVRKLYKHLLECDIDGFMERLAAFYSSIPYYYKDDKAGERYYQFLFYSFFTLANIPIQGELPAARGRMDAVIQTPGAVFVFEFKLDRSAQEAYDQIDEKRYADRFHIDGRKLFKIGINFSSQTNSVVEWKTDGRDPMKIVDAVVD